MDSLPLQPPGNRPRVFLSHSKADITFVQRLYDDLRHCQVDPWLDSEEIRHGEPWLDAIFGSGIPNCDAVLVYLTPDSIQSPMVKKEIDAGVIKKLRDERVAFLPYVSDAKLRESLRADIQALQTHEWNHKNYAEMLPRVVAEIWHSFSDRQVVTASNAEKVRRLEMELELDKLKKSGEQGIFDGREASDFEYIWSRLDRFEPIEFELVQRQQGQAEKVLETWRFLVHLQNLVATIDEIMGPEYDTNALFESLHTILAEKLPKQDYGKTNARVGESPLFDLPDELRMYGLLQRSQKTVESVSHVCYPAQAVPTTTFCDVFTEKMYRFKYWLAHHGRLSSEIRWERESPDAPTV